MPKRDRTRRVQQAKSGHVVFLSHSSKDQWIARQMAALIERQFGESVVRVFLDEKNIRGGDSIPESIRVNIKNCSEFVVLLSKNSLGSTWVNLEIGGAYFLGKPIIAILDKISPSEMPDLLIPYKAIDLNQFDRYLAELAARVKGQKRGKRYSKQG